MSLGLPLSVQRLHLRRTPGIPDPFQLSELCPGVNIVFGPNGSGKSSTLRAIEAVLWRTRAPGNGLHIAAEYSLEGARYSVELDSGRRSAQRDGQACDEPSFPAPELHHRYRLCLQDLLAAGDTGDEFASEIVRQSAGGYDLDAAAQALRFSTRSSVPRALQAELERARAALAEAQRQQQQLHAEASGLTLLEQGVEESRAAAARVRNLELALRHARARADLLTARAVREAFPAVLEQLRGDEGKRAAQLRKQIAEAEARERDAARELQAAETELASSVFLQEPPLELIPALREDVQRARELQGATVEAQLRLTDAERALDRVREQIGSSVTNEQLESIDASGITQLADFARRIEQLNAQSSAAGAELHHAGDSADTATNIDALRRGADLLGQWLRESGATDARGRARGRPLVLLWLVALAAIAGWIAVAVVWHFAAAFMVLVVIALAVLGSREPPRPDTAAMRRRDYERLELQAPTDWTPRDVADTLDTLNQIIADARVAEQRAGWRRSVELRIADLGSKRESADREAAALAARFGAAPDTDVRPLSWLTERISAWQAASQALAGAYAVQEKVHEQAAQAVASIAARVAPFWNDPPRTVSDAVGIVEAMSDALGTRRQNTSIRDASAQDLHRARTELARLRAELAALYSAAGLAVDDQGALLMLCERFPAYSAARLAETSAADELQRARIELEHRGDAGVLLLDAEVPALEAQFAAESALAEELSHRVEAASTLRARIDQAGRQSEVESCLEAVSRAEQALAAHRDGELSRLIGGMLVRHVQRATRDRHRPAVFHRARELFSLVTNGRYQLEFEQGDGAVAFRALDNTTGRGHSLDELSSGTRVQLLIAVRVAFVETQEQGHRLPLLLDEVLGTSDDDRARAVIDAVIRLAAERQIFYFTAQRDEVAKWRSSLASSGADHSIVDLAEVRRLQVTADAQWQIDPLPAGLLEPAPSPESHSHESYGAALKPPPLRIDLGAGSAHLWYLMRDPGALHTLLSRGIHTWGECRSLVESGRSSMLNGLHAEYSRASALARALEVLCEQAAMGRGRPVDREALIRSGAVSSAMLDRVHDVTMQCSCDAVALIESLERGDVARFQSAKIDELSTFLRAEGYLDDRPRVSSESIRQAMVAAVAPELEAGTLQVADLNELMVRASA